MTHSDGTGPATKLGDELRDIRVGAGAPIEQVEADLRIKAKYVVAMEEGDINALPARVYTEGFVRNYAVYLGLDPTEAVQRFFAEQGMEAKSEDRKAPVSATRPVEIDPLSGITGKSENRSGIASALRSFAALWPIVLIGGLGFGLYAGYGAARDAGLIPPSLGGLASTAETPPPPQPEQPEQTAEVAAPTPALPPVAVPEPETAEPDVPSETEIAALGEPVLVGAEAAGGARPDFLSYARADATPYWQAPPPEVEPVDGPVSEIEPETAGVANRSGRWSEAASEEEAPSGEDASRIAAEAREALIATLGLGTPANDGPGTATTGTAQLPVDTVVPGANPPDIGPIVTTALDPLIEPAAPAKPVEAPRRFALHARADAWIKVQDATGVTIYTGILSAGESYNIPDRPGLTLRTGNAGGLVIEVEGERFGPLGNSGAIMNGVPLNPGAIRASFTLARQATLAQ